MNEILPKNTNLVKLKKKKRVLRNSSYAPVIKNKTFDPLNNVNDFIVFLRSAIEDNAYECKFHSMGSDRRDTLKAFDLMIEHDMLSIDFLNGWCKFFAKNYANGLRAQNKEKTSVQYLCTTFTEYFNEFNAGRNTAKENNLQQG